MSKLSPIIILLWCFYSSEGIAQNLNLKISGASENETTIIDAYNYNTNPIDYNSILKEADSLQHKLTTSGYIESEYTSPKKTNDSTFHIQFQLNNKYETIHISYDASLVDKNTINAIAKDKNENYFSIPIPKIEESLTYINLSIANNGFPFAKVKLSEITIKDNKTLAANLVIIKKEQQRGLDNIVIKGYEKFPKSYLKRFLKIKPQKTFNLETIEKKLSALGNLRFAEQTKSPEVLFTKDSTTLYIYLQKSQSNTFDGFLGFSTNEETSKIDFNGYLNLELNNNLNYGESFNLIYKSDESEQKNFEAHLNLPYLFSTPVGTELGLKILKSDSSYTTVKQKASIFYQLNAKNRLFVGLESTTSNNLLKDSTFFTTITDYNSTLYNFRYAYENRKNVNPLFKLKSSINLELGFGNRKTVDNKDKQRKIILDAFHIFQFNRNNSFYTRFTGALLNSSSYLENELFKLGGINSIRGFQENSLTANQYIVVSTEYRYQLSPSIYAHSIIDFSNLENRINTAKENLYGFGFGFGIATKAGLLKFNFANGKSEAQTFKFSNSKIHLSLVSIF